MDNSAFAMQGVNVKSVDVQFPRLEIPVLKHDIFSNLAVPSTYGSIVKTWFPKGSGDDLPSVILLSDAHCNYDAQHNIANMLKIFISQYNINLIAVEGAKDIVDVSRFSKFQDEKAKEDIIDQFVKEGYVTGPEFLKIVKDKGLPFTLYGVEDTEIYKENFNNLQSNVKELEKNETAINEIKRVLSELKEKIYSDELKEFDNLTKDYSEGKLNLTEYALKINGFKGSKGKRNFNLLLKCMKIENRIDLEKVNKDREELLKILEKKLPKEGVEELVKKNLQFKLGKISSLEYYEYLENYLNMFSSGSLKQYIRSVKLYSKINSDMLISEIETMQDDIYTALSANEKQKDLVRISKNAEILDKLIHLKLNTRDLAYYEMHKSEFGSEFLSGVERLCGYAIVYPLTVNADSFYKDAVKRNDVMADNLIKKLDESKRAVLITGGFHTEGIAEILEAKGISHAVIRPNIANVEENNYFAIVKSTIKGLGAENLALPPFADIRNVIMKALGMEGESEDLYRRFFSAVEAYCDTGSKLNLETFNEDEQRELKKKIQEKWNTFPLSVQMVFKNIFGSIEPEKLIAQEKDIDELVNGIRDVAFRIRTGQIRDKSAEEAWKDFFAKHIMIFDNRDEILNLFILKAVRGRDTDMSSYDIVSAIRFFFDENYLNANKLIINNNTWKGLWALFISFENDWTAKAEMENIVSFILRVLQDNRIVIEGDPDKSKILAKFVGRYEQFVKKCFSFVQGEIQTYEQAQCLNVAYSAWAGFFMQANERILTAVFGPGKGKKTISGVLNILLTETVQKEIDGVTDFVAEMIETPEEAFNVLFADNDNAKKFLKLATMLRKMYPYELTEEEFLAPLEYALEEDVFFQLGPNLYMTPITESFRRHIVFAKNPDGTIKFSFEVIIPGEKENRRDTRPAVRTGIAMEINEAFPGKDYCVRPIYQKTMESGVYDLYGKKVEFNRDAPLNIVAFSYDNDGKRLQFVDPEMLDDIANEIGLSREVVDRRIAEQVAEIVIATHLLGYVGHNPKDGHDHHMGNLRLVVKDNDVKVELVADFGAFVKVTDDIPQKYRDRQRDIYNIIENQSIRSILDILTTIKAEDMHKIFRETELRMRADQFASLLGYSEQQGQEIFALTKKFWSFVDLLMRELLIKRQKHGEAGENTNVAEYMVLKNLYKWIRNSLENKGLLNLSGDKKVSELEMLYFVGNMIGLDVVPAEFIQDDISGPNEPVCIVELSDKKFVLVRFEATGFSISDIFSLDNEFQSFKEGRLVSSKFLAGKLKIIDPKRMNARPEITLVSQGAGLAGFMPAVSLAADIGMFGFLGTLILAESHYLINVRYIFEYIKTKFSMFFSPVNELLKNVPQWLKTSFVWTGIVGLFLLAGDGSSFESASFDLRSIAFILFGAVKAGDISIIMKLEEEWNRAGKWEDFERIVKLAKSELARLGWDNKTLSFTKKYERGSVEYQRACITVFGMYRIMSKCYLPNGKNKEAIDILLDLLLIVDKYGLAAEGNDVTGTKLTYELALGIAYINDGKVEESIRIFERLQKVIHSDMAYKICYYLGRSYNDYAESLKEKGDAEKAFFYFSKAEKLFELIIANRKNINSDEVMDNRDFSILYILLANCIAEVEKDYARAFSCLDLAFAEADDDIYRYAVDLCRFEILSKIGNISEAESMLRSVSEKYPLHLITSDMSLKSISSIITNNSNNKVSIFKNYLEILFQKKALWNLVAYLLAKNSAKMDLEDLRNTVMSFAEEDLSGGRKADAPLSVLEIKMWYVRGVLSCYTNSVLEAPVLSEVLLVVQYFGEQKYLPGLEQLAKEKAVKKNEKLKKAISETIAGIYRAEREAQKAAAVVPVVKAQVPSVKPVDIAQVVFDTHKGKKEFALTIQQVRVLIEAIPDAEIRDAFINEIMSLYILRNPDRGLKYFYGVPVVSFEELLDSGKTAETKEIVTTKLQDLVKAKLESRINAVTGVESGEIVDVCMREAKSAGWRNALIVLQGKISEKIVARVSNLESLLMEAEQLLLSGNDNDSEIKVKDISQKLESEKYIDTDILAQLKKRARNILEVIKFYRDRIRTDIELINDGLVSGKKEPEMALLLWNLLSDELQKKYGFSLRDFSTVKPLAQKIDREAEREEKEMKRLHQEYDSIFGVNSVDAVLSSVGENSLSSIELQLRNMAERKKEINVFEGQIQILDKMADKGAVDEAQAEISVLEIKLSEKFTKENGFADDEINALKAKMDALKQKIDAKYAERAMMFFEKYKSQAGFNLTLEQIKIILYVFRGMEFQEGFISKLISISPLNDIVSKIKQLGEKPVFGFDELLGLTREAKTLSQANELIAQVIRQRLAERILPVAGARSSDIVGRFMSNVNSDAGGNAIGVLKSDIDGCIEDRVENYKKQIQSAEQFLLEGNDKQAEEEIIQLFLFLESEIYVDESILSELRQSSEKFSKLIELYRDRIVPDIELIGREIQPDGFREVALQMWQVLDSDLQKNFDKSIREFKIANSLIGQISDEEDREMQEKARIHSKYDSVLGIEKVNEFLSEIGVRTLADIELELKRQIKTVDYEKRLNALDGFLSQRKIKDLKLGVEIMQGEFEKEFSDKVLWPENISLVFKQRLQAFIDVLSDMSWFMDQLKDKVIISETELEDKILSFVLQLLDQGIDLEEKDAVNRFLNWSMEDVEEVVSEKIILKKRLDGKYVLTVRDITVDELFSVYRPDIEDFLRKHIIVDLSKDAGAEYDNIVSGILFYVGVSGSEFKKALGLIGKMIKEVRESFEIKREDFEFSYIENDKEKQCRVLVRCLPSKKLYIDWQGFAEKNNIGLLDEMFAVTIWPAVKEYGPFEEITVQGASTEINKYLYDSQVRMETIEMLRRGVQENISSILNNVRLNLEKTTSFLRAVLGDEIDSIVKDAAKYGVVLPSIRYIETGEGIVVFAIKTQKKNGDFGYLYVKASASQREPSTWELHWIELFDKDGAQERLQHQLLCDVLDFDARRITANDIGKILKCIPDVFYFPNRNSAKRMLVGKDADSGSVFVQSGRDVLKDYGKGYAPISDMQYGVSEFGSGIKIGNWPVYTPSLVAAEKVDNGDGFIKQGVESGKIFESRIEEIRKNEITDKYIERIRRILANCTAFTGELQFDLDGYKVYGFNGIAVGKDDFFLGWNNTVQKELFISEDLIELLAARGTPSIVDEYLLHEILCPLLGHYKSILLQQKLFPQNYPEKDQLQNQTEERPYKGLLGQALRSYIDRASLFYKFQKTFDEVAPRFTIGSVDEIIAYVLRNYPEFAKIGDGRPVKKGLLGSVFVLHDMAVKNVVNPDNKLLVGVYGGSGADVSNFLLSTNAEVGYFVDSGYGPDNAEKFETVADKYKDSKRRLGYAHVGNIRYRYFEAIIAELEAIGVSQADIESIKAKKQIYIDSDGNAVIEFDWAYPGEEPKRRKIYLVKANIADVSTYPEFLNEVLSGGIDLYYQRAGMEIASEYEKFINKITSSLKAGGYLITDSYTSEPIYEADPLRHVKDVSFEKLDKLPEILYWSDFARIVVTSGASWSVTKYSIAKNRERKDIGYGWDLKIYRKEDIDTKEELDVSVEDAGRSVEAFSELERGVMSAVKNYSNVHRGTGQYSLVSTKLFDMARDIVLDYLGIDAENYTVIFGDSKRLEDLKLGLKKGSSYKEIYSNSMGLPLGIGVLVVDKKDLPKGAPFQTGGGTVNFVGKDFVLWADAPDKFEAGTPNILGVIAFAKALKLMKQSGSNNIFQNRSGNTTSVSFLSDDDFSRLSGKELLDKVKASFMGMGLVPASGATKHYVNLDNGASTPTFRPIWDVFRKTLLCSAKVLSGIVAQVEVISRRFFNASEKDYDVVFTVNTTDGINIAAEGLRYISEGEDEPVILNTTMEHNSNELPWRYIPGASLRKIPVDNEGFIDIVKLEQMLKDYNEDKKHGKKRVKVLSFSGASNVLGSMNDIKSITYIAHKYGVKVMLDAAQLAAHRKIDMDATGIDFLVFSGHKMYAPFGSSGLIARKGLLKFPEGRLEKIKASGVENAAGIAALGKAMDLLQRIGMDLIEEEERGFTSYVISELSKIPGIKIYGVSDTKSERLKDKSGVISFTVEGVPHDTVASVLAERGAIGVRSGCFCAHIFLQGVLDIKVDRQYLEYMFASGKKRELPGLVRASFGLENNMADAEYFIKVLKEAIEDGFKRDASVQADIDSFVDGVTADVYGLEEVKNPIDGVVYDSEGTDIAERDRRFKHAFTYLLQLDCMTYSLFDELLVIYRRHKGPYGYLVPIQGLIQDAKKRETLISALSSEWDSFPYYVQVVLSEIFKPLKDFSITAKKGEGHQLPSKKADSLVKEFISFSIEDKTAAGDKRKELVKKFFSEKVVTLKNRDEFFDALVDEFVYASSFPEVYNDLVYCLSLFLSDEYLKDNVLNVTQASVSKLWFVCNRMYDHFSSDATVQLFGIIADIINSKKVKVIEDSDKEKIHNIIQRGIMQFAGEFSASPEQAEYLWKFLFDVNKNFKESIVDKLVIQLTQFNITEKVSDPSEVWEMFFGDKQEGLNGRTARFFKLATLLRSIYPFNLTFGKAQTPLQYAMENGIVFQLGPNLYMTPIAESFRRHIIFAKNDDGSIKFAFEVIIPGVKELKKYVYTEGRTKVANELLDRFPGKGYTVKPLFRKVFEPRIHWFYGTRMTFVEKEPLEIMAFSYDDDGKRLEFVTPQVLDVWAEQLGWDRKKLDLEIAKQVAEITVATHELGYIGHNGPHSAKDTAYDHHTGNFRVSIAGGVVKVKLVGDFEAFIKDQDSYERGVDIGAIIDGLPGWSNYALRDKLTTISGGLYMIFEDARRDFGRAKGQVSDVMVPKVAVSVGEEEGRSAAEFSVDLRERFERISIPIRLMWHGGQVTNIRTIVNMIKLFTRDVLDVDPDNKSAQEVSEWTDQFIVKLNDFREKILEGMPKEEAKLQEMEREYRSILKIGEDILENYKNYPKEFEDADMLAKNVDYFYMFISVMRKFSENSYKMETVTLKDIIEKAFSTIHPAFKNYLLGGNYIEIDADSENSIIECDPIVMAFALGQLLINAYYLTPAESVRKNEPINITKIKIGVQDGKLVFEDNGQGFPLDILQKTILPDRQDAFVVGVSKRKGGTGLGLGLLWYVLNDHGYTISVDNNSSLRQGGARFEIALRPGHIDKKTGSNSETGLVLSVFLMTMLGFAPDALADVRTVPYDFWENFVKAILVYSVFFIGIPILGLLFIPIAWFQVLSDDIQKTKKEFSEVLEFFPSAFFLLTFVLTLLKFQNYIGFEHGVVCAMAGYYLGKYVIDSLKGQLNGGEPLKVKIKEIKTKLKEGMKQSPYFRVGIVTWVLATVSFFMGNQFSVFMKHSGVPFFEMMANHFLDFLAVPLFVLLTPIIKNYRMIVDVFSGVESASSSVLMQLKKIFGDPVSLFKVTAFWVVFLTLIAEVLPLFGHIPFFENQTSDILDVAAYVLGGLSFYGFSALFFRYFENLTISPKAYGMFEPADLSELKAITLAHNRAYRKNRVMQFKGYEEMKVLIEKEMVYVLRVDGEIKAVLITCKVKTGGDLSVIESKYPNLWLDMMNGKQEDDDYDTVLFLSIGTIPDEANENVDLAELCMAGAYDYFNDVPYVAAFSPVKVSVYEQFVEELRSVYHLPESTIEEYGIYLYLVSVKGEGFQAYLEYINDGGTEFPENYFYTKNKMPIDYVEELHTVTNGAVIADVIPHREGFSRPDSPYTIIYGYRGFENNIIFFKQLHEIVSERRTQGMSLCRIKESNDRDGYNPHYSNWVNVNGKNFNKQVDEVAEAKKLVELYKTDRSSYKVQKMNVNGVKSDYQIIEYQGKYFVVRQELLGELGYSEEAFLARLSSALSREKDIERQYGKDFNLHSIEFNNLPEVMVIEQMSSSLYLGANCTGDGWIGMNSVLAGIKNESLKNMLFESALLHELWHEANPNIKEQVITDHDLVLLFFAIIDSDLTFNQFGRVLNMFFDGNGHMSTEFLKIKNKLIRLLFGEMSRLDRERRRKEAEFLIRLGNKFNSQTGMIFYGGIKNWLARHGLLQKYREEPYVGVENDKKMKYRMIMNAQYSNSREKIKDIKESIKIFCEVRGISYPKDLDSINTVKGIRKPVWWMVCVSFEEDYRIAEGVLFGESVDGKRFEDLKIFPVDELGRLNVELLDWVWSWRNYSLSAYTRSRKVSLRELVAFEDPAQAQEEGRAPVQMGLPLRYTIIDVPKNLTKSVSDLYERMKNNIPKGCKLISKEKLVEYVTSENARKEMPDIQTAIINAGLFNADGMTLVEDIGNLVEDNAAGLLLNDDEKALIVQAICIWHFTSMEKPVTRLNIKGKIREDLDNIGYACKADEIIRLIEGMKKTGIRSMSDFYFIQELEKLLNYREDEIFKAIGVEKPNLSDLRGTSGNMFTNYWKGILEDNKAQWNVLGLMSDKSPKGVIVQNISDFGPGMINWLEGLRRAGMDLDNLKLGFVYGGLSGAEKETWKQRIMEKLKGVDPINVIFADNFEEIAEKEKPENIVYIANEKEIKEKGQEYKSVKFIVSHQAGPVLELNLGLIILGVSDIQDIKDIYARFLKRLIQDKLIVMKESDITKYVDDIMSNGFICIILPKIEKILQVWDEFKEFEDQA
jgi:selenocysteine lyase/cysteine desulfurase/tetratricopeptide (TPR) repeat protein